VLPAGPQEEQIAVVVELGHALFLKYQVLQIARCNRAESVVLL
jgi:hypothetical protein